MWIVIVVFLTCYLYILLIINLSVNFFGMAGIAKLDREKLFLNICT
jgi:hypothetical protein